MPRFKGYYSLVGLRAKFDNKGLDYWEIDIWDHDTCLTIYMIRIEHITNQLEAFGFIQVLSQIHIKELIGFTREVPLQSNVMLPFLRNPASINIE